MASIQWGCAGLAAANMRPLEREGIEGEPVRRRSTGVTTGGWYANFDRIAPTLGGAKNGGRVDVWYNDTAAAQEKRALSSCQSAGLMRTVASFLTNS